MKASDIVLGLAGLAGALWLAKRANGGVGDGSPFPPGTFRPDDASKQPDYARVTEGVDDTDTDWLAWVAPPGYDHTRAFATSPVDGHAYYYKQLWLPASRISINDLTKGDFDRAGMFLASAWKRGQEAGCDETEADKRFRQVNAELEDIASGLEIGASIGVGLASIFGYGQGAAASDKAFGFQRGADETREAQVDLTQLPATVRTDLEALDVRAAVKKDPNGDPMGANVIELGGTRKVAALANLFNISWQKWAEGNAPIDENDLLSDKRGVAIITGTDGVTRQTETGISFGLHAGGTVDPENRHEIIGGQMWLRRNFVLPWHSREMGCGLSLKERVYIRARMYRTVDLIRSYVLPVEPFVTSAGGLVDDGSGTYVPGTVGQYVTYSYRSPRFGSIRGTIFPPLPEDKAAPSPTLTTPYAGPVDTSAAPPPTRTDIESTYAGPTSTSGGYLASSLANYVTTVPDSPAPPPAERSVPTKSTSYKTSFSRTASVVR